MWMKYNYLLTTFFIYLNLLNHVFCCKPTTLTVWKYQGLDTENKRLGGFLEARLHVKGEGKREFTGKDVMFFHPYDVDGYNNKASKDKKFTLFASWVKKDLTYVWKDSKYQYLETPAREEKKSNGKLKLTYYGCV